MRGVQLVELHQRKLVDCSNPTYTQTVTGKIEKSHQRKLVDRSDPSFHSQIGLDLNNPLTAVSGIP